MSFLFRLICLLSLFISISVVNAKTFRGKIVRTDLAFVLYGALGHEVNDVVHVNGRGYVRAKKGLYRISDAGNNRISCWSETNADLPHNSTQTCKYVLNDFIDRTAVASVLYNYLDELSRFQNDSRVVAVDSDTYQVTDSVDGKVLSCSKQPETSTNPTIKAYSFVCRVKF
ncbi:MAG: hypothetical protein QE271_12595 [Bacteriovoracaceae bacterium]|nr:hypothetical protein [Bacteriovoracaceae bacterium]